MTIYKKLQRHREDIISSVATAQDCVNGENDGK